MICSWIREGGELVESRIFRKENPWRILSFLGVLQLPGQDSNLDKEKLKSIVLWT
jgi:hypothetical protein